MPDETKPAEDRPETHEENRKRGLKAWHTAEDDADRKAVVKDFPWLKHTLSAAQNF